MLCFYLPSDKLFEKKQGQTKSYEHSLVELYKKSQKSSKLQEKIHLFKKMGDVSLYLCGFFRPAIQRKIVHISYYEQMGQNAYAFISKNYGPNPNVFRELSYEFKSLSELLFLFWKKTEKQNTKYFLNFIKSPS